MKKRKKKKKSALRNGPQQMRKQEVKARALSRRCCAFQVQKVEGESVAPAAGLRVSCCFNIGDGIGEVIKISYRRRDAGGV